MRRTVGYLRVDGVRWVRSRGDRSPMGFGVRCLHGGVLLRGSDDGKDLSEDISEKRRVVLQTKLLSIM